MDLDHVGDHLPACQGKIDAVRALALSVADIRAGVAGAEASGVEDALAHLFHQHGKMGAAGVGIARSAFDDDLGLGQILLLPSAAYAERIHFRCKGSHFLTDQFHFFPLILERKRS